MEKVKFHTRTKDGKKSYWKEEELKEAKYYKYNARDWSTLDESGEEVQIVADTTENQAAMKRAGLVQVFRAHDAAAALHDLESEPCLIIDGAEYYKSAGYSDIKLGDRPFREVR